MEYLWALTVARVLAANSKYLGHRRPCHCIVTCTVLSTGMTSQGAMADLDAAIEADPMDEVTCRALTHRSLLKASLGDSEVPAALIDPDPDPDPDYLTLTLNLTVTCSKAFLSNRAHSRPLHSRELSRTATLRLRGDRRMQSSSFSEALLGAGSAIVR